MPVLIGFIGRLVLFIYTQTSDIPSVLHGIEECGEKGDSFIVEIESHYVTELLHEPAEFSGIKYV